MPTIDEFLDTDTSVSADDFLDEKEAVQSGPSIGEILTRWSAQPQFEIPYSPGMPYGAPPPAATAQRQQEIEPTSTRREFVRGLNPFANLEPPSEMTEFIAAGAARTAAIPPEELARLGNDISRQYEAQIMALGPQSESTNPDNAARAVKRIGELKLEKQAALANLGIGTLEAFTSPHLPKPTAQEVTSITGMTGRPAQLLTSGLGAVSDIGASLFTPEGLGLWLPGAGPVMAKAFIPVMATDAAKLTSQAISAYAAGDTKTGDEALAGAGAVAVMLGIPMVRARGKNAAVELSQMLDKAKLEGFPQAKVAPEIRAGSPFLRTEAPAEPISMGFRPQPPLGLSAELEPPVMPGISMEGKPVEFSPTVSLRETFDPSGLRTLEVPQEVQTQFQGVQPPAPPMAPGPRPATASRVVRLQGEAAQRMADWEKAMSEKVSQEQTQPAHPDKPLTANQLRIIQDSLRQAVSENQIPGRKPGLIADGPLEAWADKVFKDAKDQNLKFGGGDDKMLAAGVIKISAMIERGVTDISRLTIEVIRELGEAARPFIPQMLDTAKNLRATTLEGGEKNALYQKTDALLRDVQQREVTQEGAGRVSGSEGRPQTPEARQEVTGAEAARLLNERLLKESDIESLSFEDVNKIKNQHEVGQIAGLDLSPSDVPRLKQNYEKAWQAQTEAFRETMAAEDAGNTTKFAEASRRQIVEGSKANIYAGMMMSASRGEAGVTGSNRLLFLERIKQAQERGGETRGLQETQKEVTQPEAVTEPPQSFTDLLESLKYPETGEGRLYSLPHPDAIKAIGRSTWNSAIDLAIRAIKAGKAIGEAIEIALSHIRKNASGKFDEAKARANLEFVTKSEVPTPKTEQPTGTLPPTAPGTGEPVKLVSESAAKAMESKVKIAAQKDVDKLTEQLTLFNKEIGDALESGGQFLPKDLRPEVAKGAPAEAKTVTNKAINQYFVNKLSSIRRVLNDVKNKFSQQADAESLQYIKLLQERFEQAFRQVQELRRASHESLYFWNKIKAEYQDIARAAGQMPEMKKQLPIINQIIKDLRSRDYKEAAKNLFVEFQRLNLFTPGSWTLDFSTNLYATASKMPTWAIMDLGALITGRPASKMGTAMRALADNLKNWNPLGKRFRLPERIEAELGTTAGGEFGGANKQVMIDFNEYFPNHPELARQLNRLDYIAAGPVRMKRAVDGFFGRFGATAELYNRAYIEGRSRGLLGDDLKRFVEDFVQNPSDAAFDRAVTTGKELKFNRDLTKIEEAFANNILTKLVIETFPRWSLQFTRWGGEMIGVNPSFFKKLFTGKATAEDTVNYLVKAATGWGGIYAFNQLFYDNIDANSMEYVKEDGNRVRLAGRTPAPELFFINAVLRGDKEKAKAALQYLSIPGAQMLSGKSGGLLSPLFETIQESITGRYTAEQTVRELTKLVNNAIPGKSILGLIRSIYDPTVREGIGSPIPGVASLLPQRINPTTGEPLAPKQRIPGTQIEMPTVGGTPFPGAERVLNPIESALLNHGLGVTRPRRTSIIELPAEDVPKAVRQEYEKMVGKNIQEYVGEEIKKPEFWELEFDIRRELLSELMTAARAVAKADIADKYNTSPVTIKTEPLNIQRLPERLKKKRGYSAIEP